MLIQRITVGKVKVPLKVPFKTAWRSVNEMHDPGADHRISLLDAPGLGITAVHGLMNTLVFER